VAAQIERENFIQKSENKGGLRTVMETLTGTKRNLNCLFTRVYSTTLFVTHTLRAASI
jgi:hypothetical protein